MGITNPLLAGGLAACESIFICPRYSTVTSGDGFRSILTASSSFGEIFETMLRRKLDAIEDGVLFVDQQGKVFFLNKAAEVMTGWPREKALGRQIDQVFLVMDGISLDWTINPVQQVLRNSRGLGPASGNMLVRRDGTDMAIEHSTLPVHNREGVVIGAVTVFHDVFQSDAMMQEMSQVG